MDLVIFDLDGTLIDSKLDLAHSVNATRAWLGLDPLDNELVYSYVGNGAPVLIRRALGPEFSEEEVAKALEYFLEYYREHMLDSTTLYPGVQECLDRLHGEGVLLAVLTNKPVRFSSAILEGLGVRDRFFRVYGGNSFEHKKPHPVGVAKLLEESGVSRERALLVGDSAVDVRTARNAGIRCCGVTYGFQPETFADDPPDYLVDRPAELAELVIQERRGVRS
ncbi:MAG: HAD family hydrolase [Bryobacterales bacterium]|nr:phosphoglycolate phosphatase [Bryobacteraceae bacterium]MDW8354179.1 HAD family hydrolase [Bryobacterales bacterium]